LSDPELIGSRLMEAREALGLSVEDVADRMTVDPATVRSWESGESVPRPNRLHILSGMLGMPFGSLFGIGEGQPEPPGLSQRMARVEHKLEQVTVLQTKLVRLSGQIADEISEIRRSD